ncbi:MAG: alpha/beta hydrolase [Lautropia sp.]|nr:alpha/beta hydrolase [Lautropia sp.]
MRHQKLWRLIQKSLVLGVLCGWGMQAGAYQSGSGDVEEKAGAALSALKTSTLKAAHPGPVSFTPCTLKGQEMPGMPTAELSALCSSLNVPENPEQPKGRQINLKISWVPAAAQPAEADPVVVLAGGPGQAAREAWPMMSAMLGKAMGNRPVLLVDQRGTGESNRLDCVSPDGKALIDLNMAQMQTLITSCPRQLKDTADVRHYGTPDVVRDLEQVREAMKLEKLNLLGFSYGTRTAQHYARAYPQRVRSMALDSPLPNNRSLTEGAPRVYEVLDQVFAACQQHPACAEQAGDSRAQLMAALAALRKQPVSVQVPDPATERIITRQLTEEVLATTVRMMAYTPEMAGMLPEMIAMMGQQQYDMAAVLSLVIDRMMSQMIPMGSYYAATCTEDIGHRPLPGGMMKDWLRINALVRVMEAGCKSWPARSLPKEFHEPLTAKVPTLIVSGGVDPIIPPAFGDEIAAKLPTARHLILPQQGHNPIVGGCMPTVLGQFLKRPDPKALDVSCLAQK